MTSLDVVFRYGRQPGPEELRAIDSLREVYGIRSVKFNEKENTVRVEFDASRMNEDVVAGLLRRAGIDVTEKLNLV
jgi:copper chaperone CopZ